MKRTLLALVITAGAIVSGGRALAHHSFAATYFEDKTQKVEGNLVQFLYRNPHSFVHVEGPDEKGATQRWAIEWGAGGQHGEYHASVGWLEVGRHLRLSRTF